MEINILINTGMKSTKNSIDITLLLVRIFLGGVVGGHGAQKLLGWFDGYGFDGTAAYFTQTIGLPYLFAVLIILAESIGMIALISGFCSRVWSTSIVIIMLGAIFTEHGRHGFFMNWSGGQGGEGIEFHLLAIALSLVIIINGAGIYSLDNIVFRRYGSRSLKKASLV
jgi:putative oxidoreductase